MDEKDRKKRKSIDMIKIRIPLFCPTKLLALTFGAALINGCNGGGTTGAGVTSTTETSDASAGICGSVTDSAGEPMSGVEVSAVDEFGNTASTKAVTDSSGDYYLQLEKSPGNAITLELARGSISFTTAIELGNSSAVVQRELEDPQLIETSETETSDMGQPTTADEPVAVTAESCPPTENQDDSVS